MGLGTRLSYAPEYLLLEILTVKILTNHIANSYSGELLKTNKLETQLETASHFYKPLKYRVMQTHLGGNIH